MNHEPTPLFDEVLEAHPELFANEEEWAELVADPDHELVPVPDPSFEELLDNLKAALPDEVIITTKNSVEGELLARHLRKEETDDSDDSGPAGDAERPDEGGAGVVGVRGGEDREGVSGGEDVPA